MKNCKLILLGLSSSLLLAGCGNDQTSNIKYDVPSAKGVLYRLINSYSSDDKSTTKTLSFDYDIADLIFGNPDSYNKDVANISSLLAFDAYDWCDIQIYNAEKDTYENTSMMDFLGFEDVRKISLKDYTYAEDFDDVGVAYIAHQRISIDNSIKEVVAVSFEGTSCDDDLCSNFDFGADKESYYAFSGEHQEWTNKNHHKGFDVTINRFIGSINKYLKDKVNRKAETTYLVTGHSRGGAMANLYGAYLTDQNKKNFTYTFASPATIETNDNLDEEYPSIFNIVNGDDLITEVPPKETGFKRYGKDCSAKVSEHISVFEEITEERKYSYADIASAKELLINLLKNRTAAYTINDEVLKNDCGFASTLDAATKALNKVKNAAKNRKVEKLISYNEPKLNNETGKYEYSWRVAPAVLLKAVNDFFKGSNKIALLGDYSLICPTYYNELFAQLSTFTAMADGIAEAHLPEAYLTLVNYFNA